MTIKVPRTAMVLGWVLVSAGAWAATLAAPSETSAVTMSVRTVGVLSGSNVVLLETDGGKRLLPIFIGSIEAEAIRLRLNHQKPPRPMTADLLESSIAALGGKLERVEIDDLRDNTFIGKLTLRDAKGAIFRLDARPSDLISLAVGARLPIHVAPHVLARAGIAADPTLP